MINATDSVTFEMSSKSDRVQFGTTTYDPLRFVTNDRFRSTITADGDFIIGDETTAGANPVAPAIILHWVMIF